MSKYLVLFWGLILIPSMILFPLSLLINQPWIIMIGIIGLPFALMANEKEYDEAVKRINEKYD